MLENPSYMVTHRLDSSFEWEYCLDKNALNNYLRQYSGMRQVDHVIALLNLSYKLDIAIMGFSTP